MPGPAGVGQGDSVALDGDAAFTLEIHSVQDLVPKIPVAYETGVLNKAIGQGGLAMIDVGDDAKVAGLAHGPPILEQAVQLRGRVVHVSQSGEEVNPGIISHRA